MTDDIKQKIRNWTRIGAISPASEEAIYTWLDGSDYTEFKADILALIEAEALDELEDCFRTRVEFGTGGIRGKMGPGPNRINNRTIGEAAQGLAQYIIKVGGQDGAKRGVAIAYDTRHNSDVFARETACILAGNGVSVYLFTDCRATPELSFAVRDLQTMAGIVISASHNPPSDNGFKAYWSDGGQVVPPHDKNIITEVLDIKEIKKCEYDVAVNQGLIQPIGDEIDARYLDVLADLTLVNMRDIRVVYSPLHGVGMTSVAAALTRLGYGDVHYVEAQTVQDGNFPTVDRGVANPEDPKALTLAIQKAAQVGADLVLASDPDADRIGCALPLPDRGWDATPEELVINGNQIGALLCHYILQQKKKTNQLPERGLVCKTSVTTDLASVIARSYGIETVDNLLVGFKYIGATIDQMSNNRTFLFGAEESHGYLADPRLRDKEAATGVLLAECAAVLKKQGRTIRDELDEIYRTYGYFREIQRSVTRTGASGNREISAIMKGLRETPPQIIGGYTVNEVIDRQTGKALNPRTGALQPVDGDRGNILIFTFSDVGHTRVTARPSGTEPKIKYYVSATSLDQPDQTTDDLQATRQSIDKMADEIIEGMLNRSKELLS
jgi:phosphoglucomutase